MSGERADAVEPPPHSDDVHRAGYRSDCPACIWHDQRATAPQGRLRGLMAERGWFVADVINASWIESSEWVPAVLAATRPTELDEELLARAIAGMGWNEDDLDTKDEWWTTPRDFAQSIASNYARLAEDDSPLGHGTPVPEEPTLPSGDARVAAL